MFHDYSLTRQRDEELLIKQMRRDSSRDVLIIPAEKIEWTPAREKRLRQLFTLGLGAKTIARQMGLPHHATANKLNRMGLLARKRGVQ